MKSQAVVAEVESLQTEGEADRTDGLSRGTLETSSLGEPVEDSHEAKDEETGPKDEKKNKFQCKYCVRNFTTFQALGGHMNKHPVAKSVETMKKLKKSFEKNPRWLETMDSREYMPETSFFPSSNFNQSKDDYIMVNHTTLMQPSSSPQQPWQQMEPSQAWHHPQAPPIDSLQSSWLQASINDFNTAGGPVKYFTKMPSPPSMNVAYDAAVDGYYGPPSTHLSLSRPSSEQYDSLPVPRSVPASALYRFPFPQCPYTGCNPSISGPYEDPQMDIHGVDTHHQQGKDSFSTPNQNQPNSFMPPTVEMNRSSYVQYAQDLPTSEMSALETSGPQATRKGPIPSNAYDSG